MAPNDNNLRTENPTVVSSLLVNDPRGPAWIRHASAETRDIFGEPDVKGDEGE